VPSCPCASSLRNTSQTFSAILLINTQKEVHSW
jgi:hypothetical protein